MSWDDLDEEILALFGEASHKRGHTKNVAGQEASAKRGFNFGELASSRGLDLRTTKKAKAAEQKEFRQYASRRWREAAKKKVVRKDDCPICKKPYDVTLFMRAWHQDYACSLRCRFLVHAPFKLVVINDEVDTLAGWAARSGVSSTCVYRRLRKGWGIERACTQPSTPPALRNVPTHATLAQLAAAAGVCKSTLQNRRRAGMTIEEAMAAERGLPERFENTLKRRAKRSGLSFNGVRTRIARGLSVDDALTRPKVQDDPSTLASRARAAGVPYARVRYRVVVRGMSLNEALAEPRKRVPHILRFKGKSGTLQEWAQRLGVPPATLYTRLRRGMSVARVLSTGRLRRVP